MNISTPSSFGAYEFRGGTGENTILGSSSASDIDTNIYQKIVSPLDRLLADYREGIDITYNSAAQVTVTSGSIMCSNSALTVRKMRNNTSNTTVTWSDIDTGAEASATTYYVYAVCDADAETATFKVSTSSTSPSGITSYKRLGSFYNDSSSNITNINNDNSIDELGEWTSKSTGVAYQATADGFVCGTITTDGSGTSGYLTGYSDGTTSPSTVRGYASAIENSQADHSATRNSFCMPVKKGDYYKVDIATWAGATYDGSATVYLIPLQ